MIIGQGLKKCKSVQRQVYLLHNMLLTDLNLYCLSVLGLEAYLSPSQNIWLYLSSHSRARKLLLLISFTLINMALL